MKQKKPQKSQSYTPSEKEEFMCSKQIEYFKKVLTSWRNEIIQGSSSTIDHLKEESSNKPDSTDRATIESERSLELRTRDRERKLLSKINKALKKLEDGSYGYCEETMQPISIKRLVARPIATLSVEAQEMHEKSEKIYKEKEY
tara:strand:+ start:519 stop:950 length:432 start_codon:yes stop_codon:yes gene_type:complete